MFDAFGPFQDPTLWVAISFALFLLVFFKKGLQPLVAKIDSYIATIREELDKAEQLKREAKTLLDEYKDKHAKAMASAEDIVADARAQAARMQAKLEADYAEALHRKETQLTERMLRLEQQAEEDMRRVVAAIALDTAAQALTDGGVDASCQSRLFDATINTISKAA